MSESPKKDLEKLPEAENRHQFADKIKLFLLIWLKSKENEKTSEHPMTAITNDGSKTIVYLKHHEDVTFSRFCDDLFECFQSFQENQENLEKIVVATKNPLDLPATDEGILELKDQENQKLSLEKDEDEFYQEASSFKLIKTEDQRNFLKFKFIAKELIECINGQPGNYKILRYYREFLTDQVIDETASIFKQEFSEKLNFNSELVQLYDNLVLSNLNFEEANLENLVKLFNDHPIGSQESADDMDRSLDEFLEKLIIVNYKVENLDENLKLLLENCVELQEYEIDVGSLDFFWENFDSRNLEIEEVFQHLKLYFLQKKLVNANSQSFPQNFEFKNVSVDFIEFLVNPESKICYIETFPGEISLALCKIFQCLKIFLKSDEFLVLRGIFGQDGSLELLKLWKSLKIFVLEMNQDNCKNIMRFLEDFKDQGDKKFVIVGDEERSFLKKDLEDYFEDLRYLKEDQVSLSSLTENSLRQLMEKSSEFQEKSVKFSEIVDPNNFPHLPLQNWPENKTIGQNVVSSKLYDNNLYIPRSFKIKNKIRINILSRNSPDDQFAFDQSEFAFLCRTFPCKNIHWVGKVSNDFLVWRQSKGSITNLKGYVEENEPTEIFEEDFLSPDISSKFVVIVDDAGTGKSCFSNHIAERLKDDFKDHWVVNLTLNRFHHYFNDNEFENKKSVTDFMAREVLGLKTEFQSKLFRLSLKERGNVFVILDGFDEVAPFFEKNVLKMIEILGKMKIRRIFVSTRPVLGDFLENRLNVFKYQFSEFSSENQVNYLAGYWRRRSLDQENSENLGNLEKIAREILNYVNHDIPSIHLPTGIPLTLKLLAETFKTEISDTKKFNTDELSLNLFKLFDRFFDEKIRIYFHEKFNWDENFDKARNLIENEKILIHEICEKLAMVKIFNFGELNFVSKKMDLELVESEMQAILKCGLVYEVDGEFDFIHKSLAEHLSTNYLFRHFEDEDILDLIFDLILVGKRFEVVQSFMLDYIGLIEPGDDGGSSDPEGFRFDEEVEASLNPVIKELDRKRLIVLGLINKSLETPHFSTKQERILGKILCHYIENFTDIEPILMKIHRIQLAKIMRFQFERKAKGQTTNLLFSSLKCQDNCVKLLDCCFHRFKDNLNLIEDLFSISDEKGRNFLFIALELILDCDKNKDQQVDLFFKILGKFKEIIEYSNSKSQNPFLGNSNMFEKLFLSKDPAGCSIFHLLIKKKVDPLKILEFLRWISQCFHPKKAEGILKSKNQNSFCSKILSVENKILVQNYFESASIWLKESQNIQSSFDDFEEILKKSSFREMLKRRNCYESFAGDSTDGFIELKTFDQEFIEYFGIICLNELLRTESFVNLLIKSYLIEDRFKAFRSLFEHFLKANKIEINYKLFFNVVGNYILEMKSYKCSFFVTFEENNFATFDILMNAIIFSDNEIDTWGILARKIGIEFMKIVLLHKREKFLLAKNVNLLFVSLFNEKSLLKLLNFLKEVFSKSDPSFLEGILLSRDSDGRTFLHFIFYLCEQNQFDKNQILEYFFKVLRGLEGVDLLFMEKLLLSQDSDGKTLLHLMVDINIESTEIIEILKWSQKRFGLKFIKKFLVVKNKENFIFCDNFSQNRQEVEFKQIKFSNLLEEILLKFAENDSDKPEFDVLKKFARNRILVDHNYPSVCQESSFEFPSQILFDLGILKKYLDRLDFEDSAYSNYFALKGFHGFLPKSYKQKNAGKLFSSILMKRDQYKEICWLIELFFRWKLMENEVTLHTYVIEGSQLFYLLLDCLIEILETQNSLGIVEKTLFSKNVVGYSFLHVIFEYDNRSNKNIYPNLFERLRKIKRFFPEETFQELFMIRGHFGLTFLHLVRNLSAFESTLNFLQTEFNSDFVKSFLLLKCSTGNSLNWMKSEISSFIDLLKTLKKKFEISFIKDLLMQKDNDGRNFLFESTFSNPFNLNELIQVFDLIFIIFGRDFELFDDLFNSVGFWYNLDSENKLESTGIKKIIKEYEKKNQHEKIRMIQSWIRSNLSEEFLRKTLS